jgi:GT2 family glycosyltransferase
MTPAVSVIVVNWNTCELTLRCLDSLEVGMAGEATYEAIVVDNGSQDGSAEALTLREDIVLVLNQENLGYARGVNQAYERSRGELVLLLNSDVELEQGALGVLVAFLRQRPDIAGAAPLYVYPDGTPQQHHYRFPTFGALLANGSRAVRLLPGFAGQLRSYRMLDDDFSHPRAVPQPSASCLLLRRSALPPDHVFNERYPIWFNDVALARSLSERGHELWVTPEAVVRHGLSVSTDKLGGFRKRIYLASLVRYLSDTEPRYRVRIFQTVVFTQGLLLALFRRGSALPPRELLRALAGNAGRLPRAPAERQ